MTDLSTHRGSRARRAVRLSALAAAGLATVIATSTAEAAAPAPGFGGNVGVAVDEAHTIANRAHRVQYRDSFEVYEFGRLIAARAYNRALASSVGCSLHDHCRSVALSFQIVTTSGRHMRLDATNISRSTNQHCTGCQTFAGAYQFVVSTPRPFTLSDSAERDLVHVHQELDELEVSRDPIPEVRHRADDLAAQVNAILQHAAAGAPHAAEVNGAQDFQPTVTLHRHIS